MITIFLRIIIIYTLMILAVKLSGKRQIGELQLTELITILLISETAIMPIGNDTIPLFFSIIPLLSVICIEIIVTFIVSKCNKLKPIFDGKPSYIINKGKLNIDELKKLRITVDELIAETRAAGIADLIDVEYAIVELNGKFSIFPKSKGLGKEKGIAHPVIIDGTINKETLSRINMNQDDLNEILSDKKTEKEKVFLFTIDDAGNENWIFKG